MGTEILLSQKLERIVRRLYRAIAVRPSGRRFGFTLDQRFQDQVANQLGTLFGLRHESLLVGRMIVHPYDFLGVDLALIVGYLVGPHRGILLQTHIPELVVLQQFRKQFVATHVLKGVLEVRIPFRVRIAAGELLCRKGCAR